MIKVGPSVLAADYGNLARDIQRVQKAGADFLHVDVMDGHFVPNITIGPDVVAAIDKVTSLPIHSHLMIANPADFIEPFAKAGSDIISFHIEAVGLDIQKSRAIIEAIRKCGARPAVAINPPTPLEKIVPLLGLVDWVLVMTVNPGFGGQEFMPEVVSKIQKLRQLYKHDIEIDGGINGANAPLVVKAGANILAAGTFIFKALDMSVAIQNLKHADSK